MNQMKRRNFLRVGLGSVSYTHLRAHETDSYLVCRLLLEKKKKKNLYNEIRTTLAKYYQQQ